MGAEWVEDLIEGLVRTLMRMGLINLDLMDLRAIVEKGIAAMEELGDDFPPLSDQGRSSLYDQLTDDILNFQTSKLHS